LRMATPAHGELDPSVTAGMYGLTDGDPVVFTSVPLQRPDTQSVGSTDFKSAASQSQRSQRAPKSAVTSGTAATDAGAARRDAPSQAGIPSPSPAPPAAQADVGSSCPSVASPPAPGAAASSSQPCSSLVVAESLPSPDASLREQPAAKAKGRGRGRTTDAGRGASRGRGRSATAKEISATQVPSTRFTRKKTMKVDEVTQDRPSGVAKSQSSQTSQVAAKAKGKAKGKAKAKAKGKAKAKAKAVAAKGKAKAKAKASAKKVAVKKVIKKAIKKVAEAKKAAKKAVKTASPKKSPKKAAQKAEELAIVTREETDLVKLSKPEKEQIVPRQPGDPPVRKGNFRAQTIYTGPAKGWRVVAWLQDVQGKQAESLGHDRAVRWRISSPRRTRTFNSFKTVQDEEGDGIYAQIYTAVRPALLRTITHRRLVLEGNTPPQKRKQGAGSGSEDGTPAKTTPLRMRAPPKAALEPLQMVATKKSFCEEPLLGRKVTTPNKACWSKCSCDAHLRRHPRCTPGYDRQPALMHLSDYMVVGRGDTCDVILGSGIRPTMISRVHAVLHREGEDHVLLDQGSLNGITVNGEKMQGGGRHSLQSGDVVTFGAVTDQPEFDYIFEERPLGLAKPAPPPMALAEHAMLATQMF